MDMNDFCETRILPVVLAFGLGVIAADFTAEYRASDAAVAAAAAADSACKSALLDEVTKRSHFQRMAHYAVEQAGPCREVLASIATTLPLSLPIIAAKGGK